jgi:hypothetical protein
MAYSCSPVMISAFTPGRIPKRSLAGCADSCGTFDGADSGAERLQRNESSWTKGHSRLATATCGGALAFSRRARRRSRPCNLTKDSQRRKRHPGDQTRNPLECRKWIPALPILSSARGPLALLTPYRAAATSDLRSALTRGNVRACTSAPPAGVSILRLTCPCRNWPNPKRPVRATSDSRTTLGPRQDSRCPGGRPTTRQSRRAGRYRSRADGPEHPLQ